MKLSHSITLIVAFSGALFGAPQQESLAVQELRLMLDRVGYQVHSHQAEIDLFQERLSKLEKSVERLGAQLCTNKQDRSLEGRLVKLEKAHEAFITDFKNLKNHLNETQASLVNCQDKLLQIDKQLKHSLESMLALLHQEGQARSVEYYVVKQGDSLGQIALEHKTDIKTLKQLNKLSSDTIYAGQKLLLSH